jgi:acid phosphatase (class A)
MIADNQENGGCMKRLLFVAVAAVSISLTAAQAQDAPRPAGYLSAETLPDASLILPPPPAAGSARDEADRDVFRATRTLEGSPRWGLAQNDVPTAPAAMMQNFACALGAELTPQNAPRLNMLMSRVGLQLGAQVASVKDIFKRPRPYLIQDGPICVARAHELDESPDYPSGHSTWGFANALILAQMAPERSGQILARGRAYGESRVVCGVHSPSAVEAGRLNGAAIVAALNASPAFRADFEAAKAEVDAARARGLADEATMPGGVCATEADLIAKAAY